MSNIALLEEQKLYNAKKSELLKKYANKYVVIKNRDILAPYSKQYDAYVAGIEKYGNTPFLIKYVADIPEAPEHTPALWVGSITSNEHS